MIDQNVRSFRNRICGLSSEARDGVEKLIVLALVDELAAPPLPEISFKEDSRLQRDDWGSFEQPGVDVLVDVHVRK